MSKLYRKKPVVIEAMKFPDAADVAGRLALEDWISGDCLAFGYVGQKLEIPTLEGVMTASVGDYIIRGIEGEFYSCKPGIFEKTYEKVTEE